MNRLKNLLFWLLLHVPMWRVPYVLCSRYVDHYEGRRNGFPPTNGEYAFLRRSLLSAAVIFDVGAHLGDWTHEAIAVAPTATVHCFEPTHATAETLRERYRHSANVIVNECGLSASAGAATLNVHGVSSGLNSLHEYALGAVAALDAVPVDDALTTERIELDTVDDYCGRLGIGRIDYMKVDVEGNEIAVLRGAHRMINDGRISMIQFEYGWTYIASRTYLKDAFDILQPMGYRIYRISPRGLQLLPAYRVALEDFVYQNLVAVANGVMISEAHSGTCVTLST